MQTQNPGKNREEWKALWSKIKELYISGGTFNESLLLQASSRSTEQSAFRYRYHKVANNTELGFAQTHQQVYKVFRTSVSI